ncbi:uncharacterized protein B0H18DRAFT_957797 [Fomitopsis serialis]|uniref:uncharacterized protein n=1 Tax=Fomitopsis serialis TaxID=139415 RepID=UPI00200798A7|nr:uncharacterized protein B0H18DRAFT_957797 [Neoantrodia serialis]KAH9918802.1 hypothetical protein B0H18DRAFT_957797 [Neoantrodia serialis]
MCSSKSLDSAADHIGQEKTRHGELRLNDSLRRQGLPVVQPMTLLQNPFWLYTSPLRQWALNECLGSILNNTSRCPTQRGSRTRRGAHGAHKNAENLSNIQKHPIGEYIWNTSEARIGTLTSAEAHGYGAAFAILGATGSVSWALTPGQSTEPQHLFGGVGASRIVWV